MKITYYGHSCFCLTTAAGVRIVLDPFAEIGYEMPTVSADIVAVSHTHFDHNAVFRVENCHTVVREMPYRGDGLKITAIPAFHDERYGRKRGGNLIHVVEADGEVVCHLGDLGERMNDARIRLLRDLDVLLIPVGGTYTLDAVGAADLVRKLRPKYVIPMHYLTDSCTLEIEPVDDFVKLFDNVCISDDSEAEIRSLSHFITVLKRKEV